MAQPVADIQNKLILVKPLSHKQAKPFILKIIADAGDLLGAAIHSVNTVIKESDFLKENDVAISNIVSEYLGFFKNDARSRAEALSKKALYYYQKQNFDTAAKLYEEAFVYWQGCQINPGIDENIDKNLLSALYNLGSVKLKLSDYHEALSYLQSSVELANVIAEKNHKVVDPKYAMRQAECQGKIDALLNSSSSKVLK
jgi:tetratricopeptide (TPR) repeat protein